MEEERFEVVQKMIGEQNIQELSGLDRVAFDRRLQGEKNVLKELKKSDPKAYRERMDLINTMAGMKKRDPLLAQQYLEETTGKKLQTVAPLPEDVEAAAALERLATAKAPVTDYPDGEDPADTPYYPEDDVVNADTSV